MSPRIIDAFLDLLVPLLATVANGDPDTARAVVLELLADFSPQSPRELDLAAGAIGNSIKSLIMLGKSTEANLSPEGLNDTLKWAGSLARAGHQAQRRFDELQRIRRATVRHPQQEDDLPDDPPAAWSPAAWEPAAWSPDTSDPATWAPDASDPGFAQAEPTANVPALATGRDARHAPDPEVADAPRSEPDQAANDLERREKALVTAEKLLALMQQHVKGGVPPHSQAAQQLREQQRAVDVARMALIQARHRVDAAAVPPAFDQSLAQEAAATQPVGELVPA